MNKQINWIKQNIEMTMTIISGILIVLGFILQYQGSSFDVPTFIIAFIIGGVPFFPKCL